MLAQIYNQIDTAIKWVDDRIVGTAAHYSDPDNRYLLTVRLGGLQIRHLPKALRFMVKMKKKDMGK